MNETDQKKVPLKAERQTSATLFLDFLKKEWPILALASLLLAGFAVVRTYSASFISDIVEHLQARKPLSQAVGLAFAGAAVACSSYVMRYAGSMLCVMLTEKLALQTRCQLVRHLCSIPWSEYEKQKTGQLQAVIRGDVQQGADMVYSIFSRIELNVMLFVSTFVYMLIISPAPAFIIAGFTLFMAFVNQQILTRQKVYRKRSRDAAGEVAETVLTSCKGMSTVKAYRAEGFIQTLLGEKGVQRGALQVGADRRGTAFSLQPDQQLCALCHHSFDGLQGHPGRGELGRYSGVYRAGAPGDHARGGSLSVDGAGGRGDRRMGEDRRDLGD